VHRVSFEVVLLRRHLTTVCQQTGEPAGRGRASRALGTDGGLNRGGRSGGGSWPGFSKVRKIVSAQHLSKNQNQIIIPPAGPSRGVKKVPLGVVSTCLNFVLFSSAGHPDQHLFLRVYCFADDFDITMASRSPWPVAFGIICLIGLCLAMSATANESQSHYERAAIQYGVQRKGP
jgi:hypothetical protein